MNELQEDANSLFNFLMQYLFSIFLQYIDIIYRVILKNNVIHLNSFIIQVRFQNLKAHWSPRIQLAINIRGCI